EPSASRVSAAPRGRAESLRRWRLGHVYGSRRRELPQRLVPDTRDTLAGPGKGADRVSGRRRDLDRLFDPASVAVVGASSDAGRVGGRVLASLRRHRYPGSVFVVDRSAAEAGERDVLPAIDALPLATDVAVLAVSARRCPGAVDELGRRGTRNVVVLAGGF